MKRMSLNIPDRIYKKWKLWLAETDAKATQEDWICWLFENLPPVPTDIKQDNDLMEILDHQKAKLTYSLDQKKIADLIAKGITTPANNEETEMLEKIRLISPIKKKTKKQT